MSKTTNAWAIAIDSGFAGFFFFGAKLSPWHDGIRTAVFRTRKEARAALHQRFPVGSYAHDAYKPRVVRVVVSIRENT